MISAGLNESEPILNLKNLFYDLKGDSHLSDKLDELEDKSKKDNLKLLNEIQKVLQRCTHLTDKQRLMYCESQRYFMKNYLREMSKP
ncbi:MAG: hypothetical protein EAX89_16975 [Candidatus Lokiarchaeota archaeon]|nr:hypothetical protein [Candidatus Lokiarchaeota archaeon]